MGAGQTGKGTGKTEPQKTEKPMPGKGPSKPTPTSKPGGGVKK